MDAGKRTAGITRFIIRSTSHNKPKCRLEGRHPTGIDYPALNKADRKDNKMRGIFTPKQFIRDRASQGLAVLINEPANQWEPRDMKTTVITRDNIDDNPFA